MIWDDGKTTKLVLAGNEIGFSQEQGEYVHYNSMADGNYVTLDGQFSISDLKTIVEWMKRYGASEEA